MIGVGVGQSSAGRTLRASERECWIAFSLVPGIGPAGFAQLLRHHGSAAAAWEAGPAGLDGIARLGPEARDGLAALRRDDARTIVRRLAERTAEAGGRIVTGLDDEYPGALRTLDPRPPTLFVAGDGTASRSAPSRSSARGAHRATASPLRQISATLWRGPGRSSSPGWRLASTAPRTVPPCTPEDAPLPSSPHH